VDRGDLRTEACRTTLGRESPGAGLAVAETWPKRVEGDGGRARRLRVEVGELEGAGDWGR
jgi:hypothetical protein